MAASTVRFVVGFTINEESLDAFERMAKQGKLTTLEVYGDPGPEASAMLAGLGARVLPAWLGFTR